MHGGILGGSDLKIVDFFMGQMNTPSASQIALSVPWRVSAADQTFSVNRKDFIVSFICAQKQYVDFRSVILDLFRTGFALDLARLGQRRARRWVGVVEHI